MEKLTIFGTIGPACANKEMLTEMFKAGMNGVRLNLSHVNLSDCSEWLNLLKEASHAANTTCDILIDMKGPELRIGKLAQPLSLIEGETITLGKDIPVPTLVFEYLEKGQEILLDDGKYLLEVIDQGLCKVVHGGLLTSSKSMALVNKQVAMPTLTDSDIENLKVAKANGITGIMQPFVRNAQDLKTIKETLHALDADDLKVYAKIENLEGVQHLPELLPYCDAIVIARGDLGNAMDLSELPFVQKQIQDICKEHNKPYMVVTQMLNSMISAPVPTRAEVSDIFYAVYHGASAIMLTGETAAGKYPLEAMQMFCRCAKSALRAIEK